jgi:hypothetical protein
MVLADSTPRDHWIGCDMIVLLEPGGNMQPNYVKRYITYRETAGVMLHLVT